MMLDCQVFYKRVPRIRCQSYGSMPDQKVPCAPGFAQDNSSTSPEKKKLRHVLREVLPESCAAELVFCFTKDLQGIVQGLVREQQVCLQSLRIDDEPAEP